MDSHGLASGGPVSKLTFWGRNIPLSDKMLRKGVLKTRDYGDLRVKATPSFTMSLEATPSQRAKLLKLKPSK
jgi:hypothetical protein